MKREPWTAETRNPKPETRNPKPETRNPKPETQNPMPGPISILQRLLLPDLCPACLAHAVPEQATVCRNCEKDLREMPGPRCPACGGVIDSILEHCGECLEADARPWRNAVSVYAYGNNIRHLIHRYKYHNGTCLAPFFATRMTAAWEAYGGNTEEIDFVTAVPMHWLRQLLRGYNQAELLASIIARNLNRPLDTVLKRQHWSGQQALLDISRRRINVKNVFTVVREAKIAGSRILLVDDVFTTGATLTAAASTLLNAGAENICILTLARG